MEAGPHEQPLKAESVVAHLAVPNTPEVLLSMGFHN